MSGDWALIQLDQSKFLDPPTNTIHMSRSDYAFLRRVSEHFYLREQPGDGKDIQPFLKEHRFSTTSPKIRIKGTLPHSTAQDRKPFWVAKSGATTGLTFGVVNEIRAVVRSPACQAGETALVSQREWIVVSTPLHHRADSWDWKGNTFNPPFAQPGDSGAAVWDLEGRVLGFVGTGFDPGRGYGSRPVRPEHFKGHRDRVTDLTFITPIEVVFEDIKREIGCQVDII